MGRIGASRTIFRDDFNVDGPLSTATWTHQTGAGSFFGNTQVRDSQPVASGGNAVMRLDTFNSGPGANPANPTYYGTSAYTNQFFGFATSNAPGGIAFEARARLDPNDAAGNPANPSGVIAGFFPFKDFGNGLHDEIDFEWIPKRSADPAHPNVTQTNTYANDPYGNGVFQTHPLPNGGLLTEFHTYRIEWMPNQIRWFVDGVQLRVETTHVPQHDMQLYMNIWAGEQTWDTSDYGNLPPVGSAAANQTRLFEVDYVSVEALSAQLGTRAAETLLGSALDDHLDGRGGADSIAGGAGNDTIRGGSDRAAAPSVPAVDDSIAGGEGDDDITGGGGDDSVSGDAGADRLRGGLGDDTLVGGEGGDRLTGGAGADLFRFGVTDSPRRDGDVVADFDAAEGDRIDLSGIDTDAAAEGDQGFAFLAGGAFTGTPAAHGPAELRVALDARGATLQADLDGDGRADMEVTLRGVASVQEGDLLL